MARGEQSWRMRQHSQMGKLPVRQRFLEKLNNGNGVSVLIYQLLKGHITISQLFRALGMLYFRNRFLQLFMVVLSVAACVVYVQETYTEPLAVRINGSDVQIFEWLFFLLFGMDFVLSVAVAPSRLHYVLSFNGVVDWLSLVPIVGAFVKEDGNERTLGFLRIFRAVKVLRIMRIHRIVDLKFEMGSKGASIDSVALRAMKLVISLFGIVFMSAGFVLTLQELTGGKAYANNRPGEKPHDLHFHDGLYFIITTLSTVGYGDIHPQMGWARVATTAIIVGSLVLIPPQVTALAETIADRPRFQAAYEPAKNTHHLVLVGAAASAGGGPQHLAELVQELFADDHGAQAVINLRVVILNPSDPDQEIILMLAQPRFKYTVKYIKGSPLNPRFLKKAKIDRARYIFLLTNSNDTRHNQESILTAMAIKKYLGHSPVPITNLSPAKAHSPVVSMLGGVSKRLLFRNHGSGTASHRSLKSLRGNHGREEAAATPNGGQVKRDSYFKTGQDLLNAEHSMFSKDFPQEKIPASKGVDASRGKWTLESMAEFFGRSGESLISRQTMEAEEDHWAGGPRVVAQVHSERAARVLRGCGVDFVLNVNELRMALLALGTLCPGFIAVVLVLIRSGAPLVGKRQNVGGGGGEGDGNGESGGGGGGRADWQRDYFSGVDYEVYCIALPRGHGWGGLTFREAALALYDAAALVLIAVRVRGEVLLHPGEAFRFPPAAGGGGGGAADEAGCKVFVIATSLQDALFAVHDLDARSERLGNVRRAVHHRALSPSSSLRTTAERPPPPGFFRGGGGGREGAPTPWQRYNEGAAGGGPGGPSPHGSSSMEEKVEEGLGPPELRLRVSGDSGRSTESKGLRRRDLPGGGGEGGEGEDEGGADGGAEAVRGVFTKRSSLGGSAAAASTDGHKFRSLRSTVSMWNPAEADGREPDYGGAGAGVPLRPRAPVRRGRHVAVPRRTKGLSTKRQTTKRSSYVSDKDTSEDESNDYWPSDTESAHSLRQRKILGKVASSKLQQFQSPPKQNMSGKNSLASLGLDTLLSNSSRSIQKNKLEADLEKLRMLFQQIDPSKHSASEVVEGLRSAQGALRSALEEAQLPRHRVPRDLHGHILLTGPPAHAEHYVLGLRRVSDFPLVLLHEDRARFLDIVNIVEKLSGGNQAYCSYLYFVEGSSRNEKDLKRCNIEKAHAVVVMGQHAAPGSNPTLDQSLGTPEDMETLLTTLEVEQALQARFYTTLVIAELASEQSTFFMGQGPPAGTATSWDGAKPPEVAAAAGGGRGAAGLGPPPLPPPPPPSSGGGGGNGGRVRQAQEGQAFSRGRVDSAPGRARLDSAFSSNPDGLNLSNLRREPTPILEDETPELLAGAEDDLVAWPLFAAGRVFHQSTLNLLAVRLYHSPEELEFWEAVLHVGDYKRSNRAASFHRIPAAAPVPAAAPAAAAPRGGGAPGPPEAGAGGEGEGAALPPTPRRRTSKYTKNGQLSGVFDQLAMIDGFEGESYGDLFTFLLKNYAVALGLYRPRGCKGARLPYIHVNPAPDTILLAEDKIFVILSPDFEDV